MFFALRAILDGLRFARFLGGDRRTPGRVQAFVRRVCAPPPRIGFEDRHPHSGQSRIIASSYSSSPSSSSSTRKSIGACKPADRDMLTASISIVA